MLTSAREDTPLPLRSRERWLWRLENARMEISSMLDRLPRDGFPEIAGDSVGAPSFFSRSLRKEGGDFDFPGEQLLADTEFRNHGFIPLGIVFLEVVQQATPLADQHEKAAARAVVFLVRFEMLRQLTDALT